MSNRWKQKKSMYVKEISEDNYKHMEEIKNGDLGRRLLEKEELVEKVEPEKFSVREYKPRFARVTGYRLPEDSKVHCGNGEELSGSAGDFYICLDQVHEMVISAEIFKKLFLPKIDTETV